MVEQQDIDLEEAVGSYLNCLSQSCAAGSKLYTSVGKIIDKKFNDIFKLNDDALVKSCFQSLQTQNAFEDYQKALLDCKEKLLEILIDSHTKKHSSATSKNKKKEAEDQPYLSIALRVAKELYCYHQTVADVLKPLLFSDFPEDFENATLTNTHGKDDILNAWISIAEANRPLRDGFGLTNQEISQILSWQHGEDVSESSRKKINNRITSLIQQYINQVYLYGICELDIPVAFDIYPNELQKVLKGCCSPTEAFGASAIHIPRVKDEVEMILHRELPRICLCFNGQYFEKASPGKAYENTTLKLRAVRESINSLVESKKLDVTKEQIDLFCLRILSTCSLSISGASSRMATVMAFGKCNLIQVKPYNPDSDKIIYVNAHQDLIEIIIPSKWAINEDASLFSPLCRDNASQPIAVVNVSYHAIVNVEDYLVKRIEPIPIAHITKYILKKSPSTQAKKEQERSKSIKLKFITKATTKLFQKKTKETCEVADIITNEHVYDTVENVPNIQLKKDEIPEADCPVPPPRLKRKAKKTKPSPEKEQVEESDEKEAKKEDLGWFSSSTKFALPPAPTLSGSKDQSPSVASFEELQGVIDFLSGSSSSSLAINDKGEKLRHSIKTHKRNNSTTSLQIDDNTEDKVTPKGKIKLCHKKSASFSGNTALENEAQCVSSTTDKTQDIENLKRMSVELDKNNDIKDLTLTNDIIANDGSPNDANIDDTKPIDKPDNNMPFIERTPGDGMDNRIEKTKFASSVDIVDNDLTTKADDKIDIQTLNGVQSSVKEEQGKFLMQEKTEEAALVYTTSVTDQENKHAVESTIFTTSANSLIKPTSLDVNTTLVTPATSLVKPTTLPVNTTLTNSTCKLVKPTSLAVSTNNLVVSMMNKTFTKDIAKSEPSNLHLTGKMPNKQVVTNQNVSGNQSDNQKLSIDQFNEKIVVNPLQHQILSGKQSSNHVLCTNPLPNQLLTSNPLPNQMVSTNLLPNQFLSTNTLANQNLVNNQIVTRNLQKPKRTGNSPQPARTGNSPQPARTGNSPQQKVAVDLSSNQMHVSTKAKEVSPNTSKIESQGKQLGEHAVLAKDRIDETFYEPFNSKLSWSVDIGNKINATWSEGTVDVEKQQQQQSGPQQQQPIATSERIMKNDQKVPQFTLDKQQDLQKLLEGSTYLMNHQNTNENWKDRSFVTGGSGSSLEDTLDMYHSSYEQSSSMDPWPLQSSSSSRSNNNYQSPFPSSNNNPYTYNRHNINSLQLPPNPMGPYMRQNREQLLAKQQILEQYARQQKQLQIQQQQQQAMQQQQQSSGGLYQQQQQQPQQQQYGSRSSNNTTNLTNMLGNYTGSNYRSNNQHQQTSPSSSNHQLERTTSVPPGLSNIDRSFSSLPPSSRYDFNDHSLYQRSGSSSSTSSTGGLGGSTGGSNMMQHRNLSQRNSMHNSPFGGGRLTSSPSPLHMQSRSIGDLRVENNNALSQQQDSNSFSQLNDQNLFLNNRFSSQQQQQQQSSDPFTKRF